MSPAPPSPSHPSPYPLSAAVACNLLITNSHLPSTSAFSTFQARTVTQARVALDHTLSDIQLVVQTMHQFGPKDQYGDENEKKEEAATIEVGLKGSWEGITK